MNSSTPTSQAERQPSLFVPHGAPTFVLRPGAAGAALADAGAGLARPRAIVIVSPHWETSVPTVGAAERPATLHDFSGFPRELYDIRYPATGCAAASAQVQAALRAAGFDAVLDAQRGLDHGAWVPLRLMFPEADVPVLPLSIQSHLGPDHHLRLGQALAPLASAGVMILASGNLTHNLGHYRMAMQAGDQVPAYIRPFAEWFWSRIEAGDRAALLDYRRRAPGAQQAHPQEDHLLPLFVALGAASGSAPPQRLHAGVDDHVLAMDAYLFP